mmetsp:Transcript_34828/g.75964  ORF Transcript_34828/g.75964 Transcript_34828/m.75964 type:complete len:308 (-) Transcript_34828:119-1042(-)|eukprot:CAMPEP_0170592080 /NCGR_PEP_ID=MMETSP0224-20130122/12741_1 /TAXON_ID=285029 /ORGANISM="Togula jolla, Strain CCCM 725" /LENGTH=307 /DNA_ID=CAMNT_0010915977 /DNA_START=80 /DNA_END=1003 /DNA_ORIENTATION=-
MQVLCLVCLLGNAIGSVGANLVRKIAPPAHQKHHDQWGEWWDKFTEREIFMHYLPEKKVVACGCGKCGSTSMWNFIYAGQFGHPWSYTGSPYVQDVLSERWEGKVEHLKNMTEQIAAMEEGFSFALIRDPKERLISAWKSKIACDTRFGTDTRERTFLTQRLLQTAEKEHAPEQNCMDLETFLDALQSAHQLGKQGFLDRHFLPQNEGCFSRFKPSRWSMVAAVDHSGAFAELGNRLGNPAELPNKHASTSHVTISERAAELLTNVTAKEYEVLADFLPQASHVAVGASVLRRGAPKIVGTLDLSNA